jgi:copper chaperone CopZ
MAPTITQTGEVTAAIAAGGAPVVVDVLGVVCDFCAMAMNKVFGKRDEVTAVHVDLDKKTLSLVIHEGQALSDEQIAALAKKAGYRIAAIRRGTEALGG